MDVINHQQIHITKAISKIIHATNLDAFKKGFHKGVATDVQNSGAWLIAESCLANRLKKVRLSQTNRAVHKEWVVGATKLGGNRNRRRMREAISWTNNKRIKTIVGT